MDQEQVERNIAFIIEQQAKFWTDIEALKQARKEPDPRIERRLNRLERVFLLGVGAGRRERRARHDLDAKINALIDAQIKREDEDRQSRQKFEAAMAALAETQARRGEDDRQAKQEFETKMTALEAKLVALAESHAKTEEVMRQSHAKTEEVFQQSRRETEEMFQQSRRETAEMFQQSRREAEVANLESQRRFDQRMDAIAVANSQLTLAMAELTRALASTSTRVDALSAG
ncbi:MAG: hypothetical protein HYR56_12935 [Acidobacteria bacterium]|nr:hypothetical protein [Acidobacteriota bacterium]MBI3427043.1 hypothetical protein [Acidobacteriota bacterium]